MSRNPADKDNGARVSFQELSKQRRRLGVGRARCGSVATAWCYLRAGAELVPIACDESAEGASSGQAVCVRMEPARARRGHNAWHGVAQNGAKGEQGRAEACCRCA